MTVKDRTQEFHACVESIRSSSHGRNTHQERLLNGNSVRTKGEFMKTATAIGKDINQTAGKLQKLAQRRYTTTEEYGMLICSSRQAQNTF